MSHERPFRKNFINQTSSFEQTKDNSFIVHHFNIQSLATEKLKISINIVATIRIYYQMLS